MYKTLRKPISLFIIISLALFQTQAYALPQGETLVDGSATFDRTADTFQVNQSSDKVILNYNSFSIDSAETVRFVQPNSGSIALNRVVGVDASTLLGQLIVNGKIFLINPNGIVFGSGVKLDTAGMLASTLDISNDDFMNGNYVFAGPGGTITNYGTLSAPGGYIALLGSAVENSGTILADLGSVALASGDAMTLSLDPAGMISVVVDQATASNMDSKESAVENFGEISANGGKVLLTAKALEGVFDKAINTQGVISATDLVEANGEVVLVGNGDIQVGAPIYGGDVTIESTEGNVTHMANGDVTTDGDNFRGFAEKNYTLRNDASIDSGDGVIDIYAGDNIILGSSDIDIATEYRWAYFTDPDDPRVNSRDYNFREFGCFINNEGDLVYLPLVKGADIGKDGVSLTSGSGIVYDQDFSNLYTRFTYKGYSWTFYSDPALNSDGVSHVAIDGIRYGWEDWIGGDWDYNDAILDVELTHHTYNPGAYLSSNTNIFLTADRGYIQQTGGDIIANNLMIETNTGMTGTGVNGGLTTTVDHLSALNKTSGDILIDNKKDLIISDLTGETGLNKGVTGQNGVKNDAVCDDINIRTEASEDESEGNLDIEAPIIGKGDIALYAEGNIHQIGNGDIIIDQEEVLSVNPPSNLHSPSHEVGVRSTNHTIDVVWQLPEKESDCCGEFTAFAGGTYTQDRGTKVDTNGSDATIEANGDIHLALVDAGDGNAKVTSNFGSILDNDLGVVASDYDVIARNIQLSAPNGVVGESGPEQEIDLGFPQYSFSYLWDEINDSTPDTAYDTFLAWLDLNGDWNFGTSYTVPHDSDNWWFHVRTLDLLHTLASNAVHLGPFMFGTDNPPEPEPEPEPSANYDDLWRKEWKVYYEILSPSQFRSFEPQTKIGLYAYHPLTETDESAFDNIALDVGAYEFIDGNLNLKKSMSPYLMGE